MSNQSDVLALKYRPKRFEELIGQESISLTLSLALDSNRLSHAYLFSGLRGSGKTSTARIFAKSLICENGPTSSPCDTCAHCVMANEGRHMDIIEMDAASSRKIDDIRDLIEHTKYRPSSASVKIFIIDEVHMLTKEAHNALLKTLEEPPSYVKFILATTDPLKLPATILSRTQHFRFKRINHTSVTNHLTHILHKEGIEFQPEALDILARSGSGSLRDTLTLLDQAIIYSKGYVDVKTVADMLGLLDPIYIDKIFDAVLHQNRVHVIEYLKELESYEAEMVIDEFIAYFKEKLYEHDHRFNTIILDRYFRILSDAKALFSINADGGFVLGLVLFKMIEALKIKEIDEMIESLESKVPQQSFANQVSLAEASTQKTIEVTPKIVEKSSFEILCEKIHDRSIPLGQCFMRNVTFVDYTNEILTWESCAEGDDKELLKNSFGIIRQFVRDIYGISTQIRSNVCQKSTLNESSTQEEDITNENNLPKEKQESIQDDSINDIESASMIEESEVGVGSCVSNCDETSVKEFNGSDILQEPVIKKAAELFEAVKITVQSKI